MSCPALAAAVADLAALGWGPTDGGGAAVLDVLLHQLGGTALEELPIDSLTGGGPGVCMWCKH